MSDNIVDAESAAMEYILDNPDDPDVIAHRKKMAYILKDELSKPAKPSRTLNFNNNDINKLYIESHTDMSWRDFHKSIMSIATKAYKDGHLAGYMAYLKEKE